ncbi:MAG: transposase, partial [Turicibacter sp.]
YDGKNWFLSFGYDVLFEEVELTDMSLGIDVGVKDLAICSNGLVYPNINKTKEVKRLEKKLKREQRKLSRKLEANTLKKDKNNRPTYLTPLKDMKNIKKKKSNPSSIT